MSIRPKIFVMKLYSGIFFGLLSDTFVHDTQYKYFIEGESSLPIRMDPGTGFRKCPLCIMGWSRNFFFSIFFLPRFWQYLKIFWIKYAKMVLGFLQLFIKYGKKFLKRNNPRLTIFFYPLLGLIPGKHPTQNPNFGQVLWHQH